MRRFNKYGFGTAVGVPTAATINNYDNGKWGKTIPEWYNIKCEKTVEEIAPGFKCIKNAITGEILAFIHEELDDDMLDEQPSNNT